MKKKRLLPVTRKMDAALERLFSVSKEELDGMRATERQQKKRRNSRLKS
jgi:hypothetical protein